MDDELRDDAKVVYSVKELLNDIRTQVHTTNLKLDAKADLTRVVALEVRVDQVEERQTALERLVDGIKNRGLGFAVGAGLVGGGTLATVIRELLA